MWSLNILQRWMICSCCEFVGFVGVSPIPTFCDQAAPEVLSSSVLCILINKLSTSLPRWALFTWAIVHMSTWVQCSMSNVHDEQSCSMQTEPAIVATSCCQPVPVVQPAIMIYVFWIINRISQLQFKHAQGSTFNEWNLDKKWRLLGQNLVGMSITGQDKKVTVELHVSYIYPWIWSRHQSRLHMALLRNPLFPSRADWSKQRGTLLVKN